VRKRVDLIKRQVCSMALNRPKLRSLCKHCGGGVFLIGAKLIPPLQCFNSARGLITALAVFLSLPIDRPILGQFMFLPPFINICRRLPPVFSVLCDLPDHSRLWFGYAFTLASLVCSSCRVQVQCHPASRYGEPTRNPGPGALNARGDM
jgi:hypothetical protein